MQEDSVQLKVVLLGDTGVGKSSLVLRYVAKTFRESKPSLGGNSSITARKFSIGDYTIQFNIWDTAGQEKFNNLEKMYYRDADAAILIYDITNPESFSGLKRWHNELMENGPQNLIKIVAGNKEDLIERERISDEAALEYAISVGASFKKTSAKTNYGVEKLFSEIAKKHLPDLKNEKPRKATIILSQHAFQFSKSRKCCKN